MIMPAVMAYVADTTSSEERAQGMGFINAAITTGFIIGPGIGGYLAELGIRVPFFVAAGRPPLLRLLPCWSCRNRVRRSCGKKRE